MSHSKLSIRKAEKRDLDALLALENRALVELNRGCYPQDLVEQAAREIEMITLPLIEEGHFFALIDGRDRIVGCGGWSQQVPAYAKSMADGHLDFVADVAVVRSMFVLPELAGRGLGKRIMQWVEEDAEAHGIRKLTLSATRMGEPLYRSCGFKAIKLDLYRLSDGREIHGTEMEKPIGSDRSQAADIAGAAA